MSQSFSMTNAGARRENTFTYNIQPTKVGTYRIPSISMKVDNQNI